MPMTSEQDDQQPSGFIEIDEPLSEEQAEELKQRFLKAQSDGTPMRVLNFDAIIDQEEAEHGLARSQWAPTECTCPWPWPIGGSHIRTSCPAGSKQN